MMIPNDPPRRFVKRGRKTLRWYLDFTLCVVGGISFLFGVMFTQEIHSLDSSPIDWKIAVGCFVLMSICVTASRSRLKVLAACIAVPSSFLFLKFFSSRDVGALWRGIVFLVLGMAVVVLGVLFKHLRQG